MQSQGSRLLKFNTIGRCFRRGMAETKPETVKPAQEYVSPGQALGDIHKVNKLERYFLVWTKKFKHVNDVPAFVTRDTMERCRNIMRIRINLTIIAITFVGAVIASQLGKQAAKEGHSVVKMNQDWHNAYNEANKGKE